MKISAIANKLNGCLVLIAIAALALPALADENEAPAVCESILVGNIVGFENGAENLNSKKTSAPAIGIFDITEVLKGPSVIGHVLVRLSPGFSTQTSINSKPGTKWVLLIPKPVHQHDLEIFETLDGNGIVAFNPWFVQTLQKALTLTELTNESANNWTDWQNTVDEYLQGVHQLFGKSSNWGCRATVAYTVMRDGQVMNVHLTEKSQSESFNKFVIEIIDSMAGRSFLKFPQGSSEQRVDQTRTFES